MLRGVTLKRAKFDNMDIQFDNSYARLPKYFHRRTLPTPVKQAELIIFNDKLAEQLGISKKQSDNNKIAQIFSGNTIPTGSEPIAMVYAGHQFGGFSPQLGDGRAILLGEVLSSEGERYDLQLKGSGPTPYSRSGDGRSALGPVLREYLLSEAMAKLGVPTTRALCAVTTGEQVARNTLVAGGIITRIAKGFVRVGTFEYFSAQGNQEAIKQLADYEIARHFSEIKNTETKLTGNPYQDFLAHVIDKQAQLIASWMNLGFIHGVMNTDNMAISGETIDYGPCAFMDEFSHNRVYSSIDRNGRYAYANQPQIGQWNLIRLAETLLPLLKEEEQENSMAVDIAQELLKTYEVKYNEYWIAGMRKKLGLTTVADNDTALAKELLDCMESSQADFTLTFYYLSQLSNTPSKADNKLQQLFSASKSLNTWLEKWRNRLDQESSNDHERQAIMQAVNPVYIPRNHQVERAIRAAEDNNDFSVFHALHEVLQKPFEYQQGNDSYMLSPQADEVVHQTFCGT